LPLVSLLSHCPEGAISSTQCWKKPSTYFVTIEYFRLNI
jgi:hypothetical protein